MRRLGWLVVCVVLAGLAAPALATASPASDDAVREAAAGTEAGALLATLALPTGAVSSPVEPAGDGGELDDPGQPIESERYLADRYGWWRVPQPAAEIVSFIRQHIPAGATWLNSSPASPSAIAPTSVLLRWPSSTGWLSDRELDIQIATLTDGSSALRADALVLWVPTKQLIPAGARRLRVAVSALRRHDKVLIVTDRRRIERVRALLNALPVLRPFLGVVHCPEQFGTVSLDFAARSRAPLASALVPIGGCGFTALTIGGKAAPTLSDTVPLLPSLERDLGLEIFPPRHVSVKSARRRSRTANG